MAKKPPAKKPDPLLVFTGETELLISEELRFTSPDTVLYRYVLLLAHLRNMFTTLPQNYTIGKIVRFRSDEPTKDREGPMVAKLRSMVEP
jgi:hypothetical protein